MFKIQYRNAQGHPVTVRLHDRAQAQRLTDKARQDMPETHELRVCRVVVDERTGDFVWADCTADFTH